MSLSWRCVSALGQLRPALRPAAVAQLNRCSSTSTPGSGSDSGMYEPEGIQEPWIPAYEPRADEHTETKRSRLLYQSRKRGMLENGLVLSTFASRYLAGMTAPQLEVYDKLINQPSNDWDIYYWATGVRETPAEFESEIMTMLKEFIKNKGKESRIAQPGLYDTFEEKA